jgi:hypothetical protein
MYQTFFANPEFKQHNNTTAQHQKQHNNTTFREKASMTKQKLQILNLNNNKLRRS